jgi:hypothetical protein
VTGHRYRRFPSSRTLTSKDVKFIDLTGDGLADILLYADHVFTWSRSLGSKGYDNLQTVTQPSSEDRGPISVYGDIEQTIYLADMSGDGLHDLVRIRNGDICYWPNCGYGVFGTLIRIDNAPIFDDMDIFNQTRIRLTDIDGTGTTDILYLGSLGVDIYMNQAGNSFSVKKRLGSFPPIDSFCNVTALDLLGNGTSCLVWSSHYLGLIPPRYDI